jgi:hypothetical protein
MFKHLNKKKAK